MRVPGTKKYNHLLCRKQFSVLKDTVFYRSNLSLMAWFYAILLFCNFSNGVRSSFVRKQLGLGVKSAHRLCNSVRLHLACYERPPSLGGPGKMVFVDETFIKYLSDRGSGPTKGAWVMGMSCGGKVLSGVIPNRKAETLKKAIERFVEPDSIIVTDQLAGYRWLKSAGWQHLSINHSKSFSDFEGFNTTQIEKYWGHLKRCLRAYRQAKFDNLWLFLAESECRYNFRSSEVSLFDAAMHSFPALTPHLRREIEGRFTWN